MILALHGFTGTGADFTAVLDGFAHHAPDLIGHGRAPAPRSVAAYAMDRVVEGLLSSHTGSHVVVGYSMGGRIALQMALRAPERVDKLVLIGANPGLEGPAAKARQKMDQVLAHRIEREGVDDFCDYWQQIPILRSQNRIDPPILSGLRSRRRQQRPHGLANCLLGMGTGAMPSVWSRLPELSMPVLLVTGVEDFKFTSIAQRMAGVIAGCEHVALPVAGHTAHLEQPAAFRALLKRFEA